MDCRSEATGTHRISWEQEGRRLLCGQCKKLKQSADYADPPAIARHERAGYTDEFPQLYSVLKGDISFVGPRPALYNQDDLVELRTGKGMEGRGQRSEDRGQK